MLSNFLAFNTSGSISSRTAAFLFLIFLSTTLSSSYINCPSLMSSWLQILLANGLPEEIITAIIMQYKNMKVKFCSPDEVTDYFDIVTGVLQGDTLAPYLFIISLDYVLQTSIDLMKENSFTLAKARSRRYPTQTIKDADDADNISLLANTPTQAESLLHSLERAAGGIGLHVNADKTEYMCFNQMGDISTLVVLWNWWTSSPTSEAASHQPRLTSTDG